VADTRTDKLVNRLKNHPVLAVLGLVAVLLVGAAGVTGAIRGIVTDVRDGASALFGSEPATPAPVVDSVKVIEFDSGDAITVANNGGGKVTLQSIEYESEGYWPPGVSRTTQLTKVVEPGEVARERFYDLADPQLWWHVSHPTRCNELLNRAKESECLHYVFLCSDCGLYRQIKTALATLCEFPATASILYFSATKKELMRTAFPVVGTVTARNTPECREEVR
jgi:hypothetical protein